jgi:hypothetical protein
VRREPICLGPNAICDWSPILAVGTHRRSLDHRKFKWTIGKKGKIIFLVT